MDASKRAGFTLIELMVGITVLILLVVILAQIMNYSSRAWILGESSKERLQSARAIADFISNELEAALLPVNRTSTNNLQFVVNPSAVHTTQDNGDSAFWQAPYATDQTEGDIAEIGYFVKWDTSNPANPRPILCRFFADAQDANFLIYSQPSAWFSSTVLDAAAPADRANAYRGLFAENVLGLWLQCLDPLGNPITSTAGGSSLANRKFDSRLGYRYTGSSGTVVQSACALPAAVELGIVLIDSAAANRVGPAQQTAIQSLVAANSTASGFVNAAATDSALQSLRPNMQIYQTRIYLRNSR